MKRFICVIIVLLTLLSMVGCTAKESDIIKPANFYYRTAAVKYQSDAITAEIRESSGYDSGDLKGLMQLYIDGPISKEYINPFPRGLKVVDVTVNSSNVQLQFNDRLALLNNTDMSIACACLTLTTLDLTHRSRIIITAADASGNIIYTASMTKDQILLNDKN